MGVAGWSVFVTNNQGTGHDGVGVPTVFGQRFLRQGRVSTIFPRSIELPETRGGSASESLPSPSRVKQPRPGSLGNPLLKKSGVRRQAPVSAWGVGLGLLEHGSDPAVGGSRLFDDTISAQGTRKSHFWRPLICGGYHPLRRSGGHRPTTLSWSWGSCLDAPHDRHQAGRPATPAVRAGSCMRFAAVRRRVVYPPRTASANGANGTRPGCRSGGYRPR